jgi:uncharacterized protein
VEGAYYRNPAVQPIVMKIDLLEFARQGREAEGEIPIASLERVDSPDPVGSLRWTATGTVGGRDQTPQLHLVVEGSIVLVCQRCLGPMQQPVAIDSHFVIAPDEATAAAFDDDDAVDVLAQSPEFDLNLLVEDEVILALPISPRHAVCPPGPADRAVGVQRPSPFAALAALKVERGESDDGEER